MKNSKKAKKENLTEEPRKTKIKTMKKKSKNKSAELGSPNVLQSKCLNIAGSASVKEFKSKSKKRKAKKEKLVASRSDS